ncbi:zinc finger domain-containing protein [Thermacetogenium phaeum DSM 12270]|uniref:Zinc finger domain-containing protein n=1 Tax=Thermacetogenium phaeum (strain ATCC BAA-254 / DSM 26808 / PB) TaxID=1089553 RepID=K4LGQ6_THEPS|nr:SWIM zinc finger family protein [Thermacetogenium phaeum]AFV12191.1 zinc finger domain-containing protein [Thermacetogenium phaeum DSM 12270]
MDGSNFSWLTEEYIRQLADGQSFERGMNYYAGGNVRYPLRQGMELSGECYGSQSKPYRVRVVLSNNGIREAFCTCPRGGFCKHIVALLLTYVHEPDSFKVLTSLDAMLARLSREELISLIGDMVQREPSLSAVVDLAVATAGGRSPDMAALNREVKRALSLDDPFEIETGLRNILRTAERLEQKEDWPEAGAVYQTVLDALTEIYGNELLSMDDDGAIAAIACECVEGLSECLNRGDCDRETRQAWLMSLMKAELADIEMGGVDFAGDALDAIFEHAGEQDWELLRECLCEHIPKSGEWERKKLVGILVAWEERNGRHEQARRLIQEMGTAEQRETSMNAWVNRRTGKTTSPP